MKACNQTKTSAVTLVTNGDIAKVTFDLIQKAQKEIISMEFLLRDDEFGLMKLALLRKNAREKRKVYVHVDSFHLLVNPAMIYHLAHEGIEFSVYNDLTLRTATKFSYRNHCKFLIIDGEMFKTGDTNSGNEYVHWSPSAHKMKSMDVVLKGRITKQARQYALEVLKSSLTSYPLIQIASLEKTRAQREKIQKLNNATKTFLRAIQVQTDGPDQITKPDRILITKDEIESAKTQLDQAEESFRQFQKNTPSFDWEKRTSSIPNIEFFCDPISQKGDSSVVCEAISDFLVTAKKEITIVSPYLILTPKMKDSIRQALARGVEIRFYTNSEKSTDNRTTQLAYEYHFKDIARLGNVKIFEYNGPETLHAKFLLKDENECMLMTYNIDWRSEIKNLETALQFKSQSLSQDLRNWLSELQDHFTLVANHQDILKTPLEEKKPADFFTRWMIRSLEKHL